MTEPDYSDISLLDDEYIKSLRQVLGPNEFSDMVLNIARQKEGNENRYKALDLCLKPEPGDIPEITGIDISGECLQYGGGKIGGDHIIYMDMKKRFDLEQRQADTQNSPFFSEAHKKSIIKNLELYKKSRSGFAIIDVAGHDWTDDTVVGQLHQAFLLGASYDLMLFGEVTSRLIEELNKRIYNTHNINKSVALTYGEIWHDGKFRFVLAGNPVPILFSKRYTGLIPISEARINAFTALGIMPSIYDPDKSRQKTSHLGYKKMYTVNETNRMEKGDILIISTDGLIDHTDKESDEAGERGNSYFPKRLEEKLREAKDLTAREISEALKKDIRNFGPLSDDTSYIIVKRN